MSHQNKEKNGKKWWRGNLVKKEAGAEAWLLQELHLVEAAKEDTPQDTAPLYSMWVWPCLVSP